MRMRRGRGRGKSEDGVGERCSVFLGFWHKLRPLVLYSVNGLDVRHGEHWVRRWAWLSRRVATAITADIVVLHGDEAIVQREDQRHGEAWISVKKGA